MKFTLDSGIFAGIGYVVAAFTPAIGRTIKSWTGKVFTDVTSAATKVFSVLQ
jgi:hypothetical protein